MLISAPQFAPTDGNWNFNTLDMPPTSFVTGGRAWQMCRNEGADAARFGLGPDRPDVSGIAFVRGRLQLDIAALHKQELLCWDYWDNHAAALSLQADSTALREMTAAAPELRIPETITCWSPVSGPHPFKTVAA